MYRSLPLWKGSSLLCASGNQQASWRALARSITVKSPPDRFSPRVWKLESSNPTFKKVLTSFWIYMNCKKWKHSQLIVIIGFYPEQSGGFFFSQLIFPLVFFSLELRSKRGLLQWELCDFTSRSLRGSWGQGIRGHDSWACYLAGGSPKVGLDKSEGVWSHW